MRRAVCLTYIAYDYVWFMTISSQLKYYQRFFNFNHRGGRIDLATSKTSRFDISSLEHCQISVGRLAALMATTYVFASPRTSSPQREMGADQPLCQEHNMPDTSDSRTSCGLSIDARMPVSRCRGGYAGGPDRCSKASFQPDFLRGIVSPDGSSVEDDGNEDYPQSAANTTPASASVAVVMRQHSLPPSGVIAAVEELIVDILLDRDHMLQYTHLQMHEALKSCICPDSLVSVVSPLTTWRLLCLRLAAVYLHRTLSVMITLSHTDKEFRSLLAMQVQLRWMKLVLQPDLRRYINSFTFICSEFNIQAECASCFMGFFECNDLFNLLDSMYPISENGFFPPDCVRFTLRGDERRDMFFSVSILRLSLTFTKNSDYYSPMIEALLLLLKIQNEH